MSHNWTDLAAISAPLQVQADVCIIGAGAVGIYLASELAMDGIDVVLVEAGPVSAVDVNEIGFKPVFSKDEYPGATQGRFFGMGGTTTRWGGALVPHTEHDLRSERVMDQAWPTIVDRVSMHADAVLHRLGYGKGADFDEYARLNLGKTAALLAQAGIDSQASLLLPFRHKNLLGLLSRTSHCRNPPRIFFNAVAKNWIPVEGLRGDARIAELVAVSNNNNELTVNARKYVVAAGAIESARILMEIDESASSPIIKPASEPGCYLADHLSLPIADVAPDCLKIAGGQFSPRFSGAWMRGFRLLEISPVGNAPRSFAHFIFPKEGAGFNLAKKLMQSVQLRRLPDLNIGEAIAGLDDLAKLAYFRYMKSRLYAPTDQPIHLQLDMEQRPIRENRVDLVSERDEYGRKKARIHWTISDQDVALIEASAKQFLSLWPGKAAGVPELLPRPIGGVDNKPYDAYHPVGTCRMGALGAAVVDTELKLFGIDNLWVVNTGVLPSAGTANPTFTTLCLAHHLVRHLRPDR